MSTIVDIVMSGLFQGSLYAMIAVGLALVWTTIGVFNFAHGVLMTVGAYIAWQLASSDALGLPIFIALPIALLASAAIGLLMQAAIVRPFIGRPDVVLLAVITTLAAASIFENGTLLIWGPRPMQLPPLAAGTVKIMGIGISAHQLIIILVTPVILAALWFFLTRMRLGLALRAVAQNEDACHLVGLNVAALYGLAFGLAAALAGLAGIFLGGFTFMSPTMGSEPLSKALVVVIFGGLGTIAGPIFAAYIIAFFEAISIYFIGFYWTPALLFAVLILTLMLKPEGLFSRRSRSLA
ncbi:branched-chain amino acid ABC transporter permease [Acidisoma cellulosilytica]|uniref:Branched-chain amino acid ABC transporter permease n=1 Tax=Acidisoma cellulosilyticum TaxID=2802395 RepID=A0A963Z2I1_9PROT|nr:branched-chain amino acid ABC transporter permease [Acidisoma cellulosilyticum]MCB8881334.1 branched-chain amino acid ABC transporter permease [Acidisoma cellulosilyticum]